MVVSIPEFDVKSLAVSPGSVTHTAPCDRERIPRITAIVGPVERIDECGGDVRLPVPSANRDVTDEVATVGPVSDANVGSGRNIGVYET